MKKAHIVNQKREIIILSCAKINKLMGKHGMI